MSIILNNSHERMFKQEVPSVIKKHFVSRVALHKTLALNFCNSLLQRNSPSPSPHHHCNQYFNHCLHSYVDLPMLHEISYFHMKLPVSRVGARRRLRINSVGLETSPFFLIYIFFSYDVQHRSSVCIKMTPSSPLSSTALPL